jgi:predicted transcriptional regulator
MTVEILLVRDEKVVFRLPLGGQAGDAPSLDDAELGRLSDLYAIGANRRRLRVMFELARGKEMRFSDVMQIVTNPKLAQDCLQPLLQEGLVLHGERGSSYRASRRGVVVGVAMTLGVGGMLDALERDLGDAP